MPYNAIATWLYLIGTPERALKLRGRVERLAPPPFDPYFGVEAAQCPTTVLFGLAQSQRLYADPRFRPALDAWDTGEVVAADIRRLCLCIEKGQYDGPVYSPTGRT